MWYNTDIKLKKVSHTSPMSGMQNINAIVQIGIKYTGQTDSTNNLNAEQTMREYNYRVASGRTAKKNKKMSKYKFTLIPFMSYHIQIKLIKISQ